MEVVPANASGSADNSTVEKRKSPGISRLPDELLCHIFLLLQEELSEPLIDDRHVEWLAVVLVCRRWREIAMNPRLWTQISTTHFKHVGMFLERSKATLLDVRIVDNYITTAFRLSSDMQLFREAQHLMLQQWSRIRKLAITLMDRSDFEATLPSLSLPAPNLETLVLETRQGNSFALPNTLLGGIHPRLKTVQLVGVGVSHVMHVLCGLTSLNMSYIPIEFQPTVAEMLAVLQACPNLQYLRLDRCLRNFSDIDATLVPSLVPLLNLHNLSLYLKTQLNVALLSHINFTRQTALCVQCDDHSLLLPYPTIPPEHLSDILHQPSIRVEFWRDKTDILGSDPLNLESVGGIEVNLLHYERQDIIPIGVRLRALKSVLPVSSRSLYSLTLVWKYEGMMHLKPLDWPAFLADMKFMHSLSFSHGASGMKHALAEEDLLDALLHEWPRDEGFQFCPHLATLEFTNVNFGCSNSTLVPKLKRLFSQECPKIPLRTLIIQSCNGFARKDADELRRLSQLHVLVWDRREVW